MQFKYKGKKIEVPDNFIIKCGEHAESRGMTLEEYISEAFGMLNKNSGYNFDIENKELWNEKEADRRMNVIGQNGNEGLHYEDIHDDCGTDECCKEC
jgi:hypothetical protein